MEFDTEYANWADAPTESWRWQNFTPQELASRGDGKLMVNEGSLDKLQKLRELVGRPLIITSAYRSPAHNRTVGGARASQHLYARAFDVVMGNHDPKKFVTAARVAGFTGFGFYRSSNFIHIDTGPPRTWGGEAWAVAASGMPVEPPIKPEGDRVAGAGAAINGGAVVAGAATLLATAKGLDPIAQYLLIGGGLVAVVVLLVVFRKRLAGLLGRKQ